jgi:hypothetical protein
MFMPKILNNLPQPPKNNPWPTHSTNWNFKTRFHWQWNYLLGFQAPKKINNSILEKKWPINESDAKDNPYATFAYNKEMDQLVEANAITSEVEEEEDSIAFVDVEMM